MRPYVVSTVALGVVLSLQTGASAQTPCQGSPGPDVIVGDLIGIVKYGTVGNITGYSIGTTSCNMGTANLKWIATSNEHPVIAQNLYRFIDGRFEQIGMSWLKHGFTALTQNLCCTCNGQGGTVLGVGCSDPYNASLNGDQNGFSCGAGLICGGLGPRHEVNAATGVFSYPYGDAGQSGGAIYKRLQVHNDDIDPALNPSARFYMEGHYVTPDDAAAGNHHNNASYRLATVGTFTGGGWNLSFTSTTQRELPAIYAWQASQGDVVIVPVDDQSDGQFNLGYRVSDNGDGTWHYEYALHNLNSHRAAREFIVPVGAGVSISNVGFHDVDYHSSDGNLGITNYDDTDWPPTIGGSAISWSTDTEAANANANALRWSTLYNFRFDANTPPTAVDATIGLYRAGSPASIMVSTMGPGDTAPCPFDCGSPADGAVSTVDLLELLAQWGMTGSCDFGEGGPNVDTADLLALLGAWGPCP